MSDVPQATREKWISQDERIAALEAERVELLKKCHYAELSTASLVAIRRLLAEHDVPDTAFIDDYVGNAIVQRNQARQRGDTYRARALALVRACREERWVSNWIDEQAAGRANDVAEQVTAAFAAGRRSMIDETNKK